MDIDILLKELEERAPQWAPILPTIQIIETDEINFADNDGRSIYINTRSLDEIAADTRCFYLARQVLHILFNHRGRGEGKFPNLWRYSCDMVANTLLREDGFILPSYIQTYPTSQDCGSAEGLYFKLLVENNYEDSEYNEPEPIEIARPDVKLPPKPGGEKGSRLREIDEPGLAAAVEGLAGMLDTSVQLNFDWFPGDTIRDGLLRDKFKAYPVPHAEILLDTSSSVDANLLRTFVKGVKSLLAGEAVIKVGCFDTEFYGFSQISSEEDVDRLELMGSGGTNFSVALDAFSGDAETQIIFTDGCAEMPERFADVIWVVYGNTPIHPMGGRVLYVKNVEEKEKDEIVFLIT